MKIQIASDLHLEFPENTQWFKKNPFIPKSEVLILAGDIVYLEKFDTVQFFFEDISEKFERIIYLPGNHDYFGGAINKDYSVLNEKFPNVEIIQQNKCEIISETRFIFSTLWTRIPKSEAKGYMMNMNDYRQIFKIADGKMRRIDYHDTNRLHSEAIVFIENELLKIFDGKTVVVTHHAPDFSLVKGVVDEKKKHAYASDLAPFIEKYSIHTWIFGHKHVSINKQFNRTRFISNPLGYLISRYNKEFTLDYTIEI